MLKHLRLMPFIGGIVIGVLMILYYKASDVVVYEYPHPQNVNDRVYKDNNGLCYTYTAKNVDCDANEATLKQYPIQG